MDDFSDIVPFWEQQGNEDTKWRLITNTIEKAITFGISQTQTALQLRLHDFTFGNDRFRQIFRERRDFRVAFEYPATLDGSEIPNPNQMAQRNTLREGEFQYVIEYDNYVPEWDVHFTERTSIFTNEVLSKDDVEGIIEGADDEDTSPKPFMVSGSARLVGAFRG